MTHMITSAIVHGIIYDLIWRALDRLPLGEAAVLGIAGIAFLWLIRSMFRKPRSRRW